MQEVNFDTFYNFIVHRYLVHFTIFITIWKGQLRDQLQMKVVKICEKRGVNQFSRIFGISFTFYLLAPRQSRIVSSQLEFSLSNFSRLPFIANVRLGPEILLVFEIAHVIIVKFLPWLCLQKLTFRL